MYQGCASHRGACLSEVQLSHWSVPVSPTPRISTWVATQVSTHLQGLQVSAPLSTSRRPHIQCLHSPYWPPVSPESWSDPTALRTQLLRRKMAQGTPLNFPSGPDSRELSTRPSNGERWSYGPWSPHTPLPPRARPSRILWPVSGVLTWAVSWHQTQTRQEGPWNVFSIISFCGWTWSLPQQGCSTGSG